MCFQVLQGRIRQLPDTKCLKEHKAKTLGYVCPWRFFFDRKRPLCTWVPSDTYKLFEMYAEASIGWGEGVTYISINFMLFFLHIPFLTNPNNSSYMALPITRSIWTGV